MKSIDDLIWNSEENDGDKLDLCGDGPPMIPLCQVEYAVCNNMGGGDNPDPYTAGSYQGSNQCGC